MKMKFFFILLACSIDFSSAQRKREPTYWTVIVPDSIATLLDKECDRDFVNASANVANLLDTKKKSLIDGIYTFKGQGPHFPRRLFFYHDKKLFIFKSKGAFDPVGIIKEYGIYLSQNKLSPNDVIKYLKAIYTYLDSERGQTYGRYVKPEN